MRPKNLNLNAELKLEGRKIHPRNDFDKITHNPPQMGIRNA